MIPKELTTVTRLSKFLALFAFIVLPFIGFVYGQRFAPVDQQITVIAPPHPVQKLIPPEVKSFASFSVVSSGAEVLLTDMDGQQTGYDLTTSQRMEDIPDSMYFNTKVIPFGGKDDGRVERNLIVNMDVSPTLNQAFDLDVVNSRNLPQEYLLMLSGEDDTYHPHVATLSGSLRPTQVEHYHLDFFPGKEIHVRKIQ